jgi:hypothetical protein
MRTKVTANFFSFNRLPVKKPFVLRGKHANAMYNVIQSQWKIIRNFVKKKQASLTMILNNNITLIKGI